ncbi:unnamed protein product [Psylliodes chrysocephalus]|uniref:Uncharacterized protein n=1 Tax=Psylliodes chrysocephalus TaxID=3402493 RepID=A0A9P0CRI2_9CUCU|nr:unnamed protein product [Psylliodes chrysocephala]
MKCIHLKVLNYVYKFKALLGKISLIKDRNDRNKISERIRMLLYAHDLKYLNFDHVAYAYYVHMKDNSKDIGFYLNKEGELDDHYYSFVRKYESETVNSAPNLFLNNPGSFDDDANEGENERANDIVNVVMDEGENETANAVVNEVMDEVINEIVTNALDKALNNIVTEVLVKSKTQKKSFRCKDCNKNLHLKVLNYVYKFKALLGKISLIKDRNDRNKISERIRMLLYAHDLKYLNFDHVAYAYYVHMKDNSKDAGFYLNKEGELVDHYYSFVRKYESETVNSAPNLFLNNPGSFDDDVNEGENERANDIVNVVMDEGENETDNAVVNEVMDEVINEIVTNALDKALNNIVTEVLVKSKTKKKSFRCKDCNKN